MVRPRRLMDVWSRSERTATLGARRGAVGELGERACGGGPASPAEDLRMRWSRTRQPCATPRPKADARLTEPAPAQATKLFKRAKPASARPQENGRLPPSRLDKYLSWMSRVKKSLGQARAGMRAVDSSRVRLTRASQSRISSHVTVPEASIPARCGRTSQFPEYTPCQGGPVLRWLGYASPAAGSRTRPVGP